MSLSLLILFIFEITVWCIAIEIFRFPDEREDQW